jgi:hypothetical protein
MRLRGEIVSTGSLLLDSPRRIGESIDRSALGDGQRNRETSLRAAKQTLGARRPSLTTGKRDWPDHLPAAPVEVDLVTRLYVFAELQIMAPAVRILER